MNSLLLFTLTLSIAASIASSSKFPIELSVSQHRKYFPHELSTFTQHVNIEIKSDENAEQQPQLVQELFLILDTSGSMAAEQKLENAKLAIENIIQHMHADDKLHLIEYSSGSSIVFEDENNRASMSKKLKALHASGGTNLMSGFDETKLLLVFSDGQISKGVTAHDQLLQEITSMKNKYELTVCSFGIGSDFDAKLMPNIADYGSGDFFFIRGADSMKKVVDIAYKGFKALMGTNAYLKITTKNGANLVDTFGYESTKDGANEIIPIGDISYNDNMNVLLETEIQISEKFLEESQIDYMIIELWMTDIHDQISKLVATESVLFSLSKNQDELNDLNQLVEYLVQLQNIQKREKEVTILLKQGRTDEALKAKRELSDESYTVFSGSSSFHPKTAEEAETAAYIQSQSGTVHRRSGSFFDLSAQEGITDDELAFQNEYYTDKNSKYRKRLDEL